MLRPAVTLRCSTAYVNAAGALAATVLRSAIPSHLDAQVNESLRRELAMFDRQQSREPFDLESHLLELRALRQKLEQAMDQNEALRQQLEEQMRQQSEGSLPAQPARSPSLAAYMSHRASTAPRPARELRSAPPLGSGALPSAAFLALFACGGELGRRQPRRR